MRLPATRSLPLICLLCLFGGASIALATSAHRSRERPSHTAQACHRHRAKHRHCLATRGANKSHHKHTRGSLTKPSAPGGTTGTGSSGASGAPWTAAPAPVIPGSTTHGSGGTSPGSGGAPVTEVPTAPTGPAHVQVTAEDTSGYHFILSRTSVPAGPVVLEFVNHGQDEHNLHAVEPAEGAEAGGLKENVKPDAHTDLTLNLHAGSYTLFCSLPGHEAKGMKATLVVE
jgi:plastocyanin